MSAGFEWVCDGLRHPKGPYWLCRRNPRRPSDLWLAWIQEDNSLRLWRDGNWVQEEHVPEFSNMDDYKRYVEMLIMLEGIR